MSHVAELFARHNLRCTSQRETIYHVLCSTTSHPTAEELLVLVRRKQPGISLATVYNTLEAFTRRGLARRFSPPNQHGPARYDADTTSHVHFVEQGGVLRDVPHELGEKLVKSLPQDVLDELEERLGVQIGQVRIELIGRSTGSGGAC